MSTPSVAQENGQTRQNDAAERKAVVAGRWRLLRDALKGKPISRKPAFGGYEMIAAQRLTASDEYYETLKEKLQSIVLMTAEEAEMSYQLLLVDALETSLLGLHAVLLDDDRHSNGLLLERNHRFTIIVTTQNSADLKSLNLQAMSRDLCQRCEFDTCTMRWEDEKDASSIADNTKPHILHISVTISNRNRFLVQRYTLGDAFLLVRERSPEQVLSMAELTSHRRGHAIDNTGNVCVWDCEKTLLWALLQQSSTTSTTATSSSKPRSRRILELGAGMAGLVALGLAAATQQASHVTVTDGNPGCLQSNRTHVRLMEAVARPFGCTVEARLLPWALQAHEEGDVFGGLQRLPAHLSVVSDCTHFEQYHGHLLWTLIQCTATKQGEIWMCHPDRGRTLERFLDMVRLFVVQQDNNDSSSSCRPEQPLLSLQELTFPELDEKHQHLERNDPNYRPNVHRPRIFCISKIREATDEDRSLIIQHMATRDSPPTVDAERVE